MRAPGLAARSSHALSHLVDTDINATLSGRFLFGRSDPADPLVSHQRSDIGPKGRSYVIKRDGVSEICGQLVNRSILELLSIYGCVYWGLTPELSRAAKRRRLE